MNAVLSSYSDYKVLRNDLTKKGLLHRVARLKEMNPSHASTNSCVPLNPTMDLCVRLLSQYDPPPLSIPINADNRTFDWTALGKKQFETVGRYYDVIMMDPPWQLATANPTRGVGVRMGDERRSPSHMSSWETTSLRVFL